MIVADTDVLIDYLGGVEPGASHVTEGIEAASLYTTSVTRFELLSGARTPRQRAVILDVLALVRTLPISAREADLAADVRHNLDRAGASIGMADSLIAGIALAHGGRLLTHNRKHFERVSGLRLIVPE
jgi:predicted nucleic acid-binding protein